MLLKNLEINNMVTEILFIDRGVVKLTEEGFSMGSFSHLYDSDKNTGKPLFKKMCEALWYIHSKSSPYWNMSLSSRIKIYCENKGNNFSEKTLNDIRYIACEKDYIKVTQSREDIQYQKLMDDIDGFIERLGNVPMDKEVSMKFEVVNPLTDEKEYRIEKVMVPNSEERLQANKHIKEMYNMRDYLSDRIAGQAVKKENRYVRIFDNLDS